MRRRDYGVVITVYVESSAIPSRYNGGLTDHRKPKVSTKYGYDRRAQLLAHARRLRRAAAYNNDFEGSTTRSTSKKPNKKWRWRWRWKPSSAAKLRRSFRRIFRKKERGYDRMGTETDTINHSKRKGTTTTWRDSLFCRSLMRMVKGCYGHDKNVS